MLSSISITQLLIVLVIVICIFGTRRFRQAGGDLGAMIKGIKDGFGRDSVEEVADDIADAKRSLTEFKEKVNDSVSETNPWSKGNS